MPLIKDIGLLIDQLKQFQLNGFIFRGHKNFKYMLIPNAFRSDTYKEMKNKFGVNALTINKWFKNKLIMEHVNIWLPEFKFMPGAHQVLERLLKYCLYLMHYNHSLNLFVQNNPHRVSQKDRSTILERSLEFWTSEKTFLHLFSSYFPRLIRRYHLDGTLMQDATLFEDLASVDETLPQHYDTPTAALDWTFNYNIAIYFATRHNETTENFLTIYALKIHNKNSSPIHMMEKNIHVENIRIERQEGTFTYFTKPCSFYIEKGYLPSINYFDQRYKNNLEKSTFELIEFVIERTSQNINKLRNQLKNHKIDEESLFPDIAISAIQ
jgi:hypothetical protein